jgi:hypothetical protein
MEGELMRYFLLTEDELRFFEIGNAGGGSDWTLAKLKILQTIKDRLKNVDRKEAIELITMNSSVIPWYKDICECCGQGGMLCRDQRCPDVSSHDYYELERLEREKQITRRTFLQKIAARILNED